MAVNPEQAQQDARIQSNLRNIKHIIMVMSGKGGVGKSTVSTNLAYQLALENFNVGIMDVDIHGPNIPKMLGIEEQVFSGEDQAIEPVEVLPNLKAASIGLVGYDKDQALIWRGPLKVGLIRQFLGDVVWGELDYLIIDTPPGTGDESLTLAQIIPNMSGAVVVTTPQDVAILDSRKSLGFAKKLRLPVLGLVENMSGFICGNCGETTHIFKQGGGKATAQEYDIPFLGEIPLEPSIALAGDSGRPYLADFAESATGKAFASVISNLTGHIETLIKEGRYRRAKVQEGFKPER